MKVYIVRHGQTDSNLNHIYSTEDSDLNNTGIKQVHELGNRIKYLEYDIIYSSPLLRAIHTANIINYYDKKIIIDERLKERSSGNLAGKSFECTNRDDYWDYYSKVSYGSEETMESLFIRVKDFLDELKNMKYSSVLIVAHSGISKAFYAYFNGIPGDGKFLNLGLKNGEIIEYELN